MTGTTDCYKHTQHDSGSPYIGGHVVLLGLQTVTNTHSMTLAVLT